MWGVCAPPRLLALTCSPLLCGPLQAQSRLPTTALCRHPMFQPPWDPSNPWPRLLSVPPARPQEAPTPSPPHGPPNPRVTSVLASPLGLCPLCSPSPRARRRQRPAGPALRGGHREAPGDWRLWRMDPSGFHLDRLEDSSPPGTFLLWDFCPSPATSPLTCWRRPRVPGPAAGRLLCRPVWDSACPSPAGPASWALQASCPLPAHPGLGGVVPGWGSSLGCAPHRVPWPSEGLTRPQEPLHPGQDAAHWHGRHRSAPALASPSQVP